MAGYCKKTHEIITNLFVKNYEYMLSVRSHTLAASTASALLVRHQQAESFLFLTSYFSRVPPLKRYFPRAVFAEKLKEQKIILGPSTTGLIYVLNVRN